MLKLAILHVLVLGLGVNTLYSINRREVFELPIIVVLSVTALKLSFYEISPRGLLLNCIKFFWLHVTHVIHAFKKADSMGIGIIVLIS